MALGHGMSKELSATLGLLEGLQQRPELLEPKTFPSVSYSVWSAAKALREVLIKHGGDPLGPNGQRMLELMAGKKPAPITSTSNAPARSKAPVTWSLTELPRALKHKGVELTRPWQVYLRNLPTRCRNALTNAGIVTLGQLISALRNGKLLKQPGFGGRSQEKLTVLLSRLANQGPEVFIFGERGRPQTIPTLVHQALDSLSDNNRAILVERYQRDHSLSAIADDRRITTERVRQMIDKATQQTSEIFGPVASELLGPMHEAIKERGGLLPVGVACEMTGVEDPWMLRLAYRMTPHGRLFLWQEAFVVQHSRGDFKAKLDSLLHALRSTGRGLLGLEAAGHIADQLGLRLEEEALAKLIKLAFEIDVQDGWVHIGRSKILPLVRLLQEAGRPMHVRELTQVIRTQLAEHLQPTPATLRSMLLRHPDIYSWEHGIYIHADILPLDEEAMGALVEFCQNRLTQHSDMVATPFLLEEAKSAGLDTTGVTSHLLKDVISRHAGVITFKNTVHVAWAPTFEAHGVCLGDRLVDVLKEHPEPLSTVEIARKLPDTLHYSSTSIDSALRASGHIKRTEDGRYHLATSTPLARSKPTPRFDELVLEGIPPEAERIFSELLSEPPRTVEILSQEIAVFRESVHVRAQNNPFVQETFAISLCDQALELVRALDEHPGELHHRVVQAAVRYLLLAEDADEDFNSITGFDDDAEVLDAVTAFIERDQHTHTA